MKQMIKVSECPVSRTAGETEPGQYDKSVVVSPTLLEQSCKHEMKKGEEKYKRRVSFYQNKSIQPQPTSDESLPTEKNSFDDESSADKIEKVGKEKRVYVEGTNYYVKENRFYRHPRHTTWQDDEDLSNDDDEF